MPAFLLSRLYQTLTVIFAMSFICYLLLGLMPGDPIDLLVSADPRLTADDATRLKALYGLDQSLGKRYLNWLTAALQGDLGYSRLYTKPVLVIIAGALQNTLLLMGIAFLFSIALAIPTGVFAARRIHTLTDYSINLVCFAGLSIPAFWLALMLILVFSVMLGWLPASATPLGNVSILDQIKSLILPIVALSVVSVGGLTRYVRSSLHEALQQDYITTAYSKGLSESQVVWRHGLRNSMIPVITVVSLDVGTFFSGALIIEIMFGYPGMGKLIYDAIQGSDYNLALAGLLLATFVTLLVNFLADISYAILDPRISYRSEKR